MIYKRTFETYHYYCSAIYELLHKILRNKTRILEKIRNIGQIYGVNRNKRCLVSLYASYFPMSSEQNFILLSQQK